MKEDKLRDVVESISQYKLKTGFKLGKLLSFIGISYSKYYEWKKRYDGDMDKGEVKRETFNKNRILDWEREAILEYGRKHLSECGYRRLCYRMLDEDIVAVSPSTVYRVLKAGGLLGDRIYKRSSKGQGFIQPKRVHEHWHIDISYIRIMKEQYFLISIIDGYSRYIVNYGLFGSMTTKEVELVLQEALEEFSGVKPRIISDNGSQFISNEFKSFINYHGLCHVRTSVGYPESNGKKERFYQTLKKEHVKKRSYLSYQDAQRQISEYIEYYNKKRLHSAINYLTPEDALMDRKEMRLAERKRKLDLAKKNRIECNEKKKSSLFQHA